MLETVNDQVSHRVICYSGPECPTVIVKSRHYFNYRQRLAIEEIFGKPVNIIQDFERFKNDDNENEVVDYINFHSQNGCFVYLTCYGLAYIRAFAAGCKFGTFERFECDENDHRFILRSITHYNCHLYLKIMKVLFFTDKNSIQPKLVDYLGTAESG
jgi:hypothetical protein